MHGTGWRSEGFWRSQEEVACGSQEYVLAFVLEGFAKIYAHEKELKVLKSEIRKKISDASPQAAKSQWSSLHKAVAATSSASFWQNRRVPPDSNTADAGCAPWLCWKTSANSSSCRNTWMPFATFLRCSRLQKPSVSANPVKWLKEYGRAIYIHFSDRTLDYLVHEGLLLKKLCKFTKDFAKEFPVDVLKSGCFGERTFTEIYPLY